MSQSTYYRQQAELCERQAAFATLEATGQSFLSAAAQWRDLAARATEREAVQPAAAPGTAARLA